MKCTSHLHTHKSCNLDHILEGFQRKDRYEDDFVDDEVEDTRPKRPRQDAVDDERILRAKAPGKKAKEDRPDDELELYDDSFIDDDDEVVDDGDGGPGGVIDSDSD